VLTGFNYHGPDGQVVGDRDFGTLSVVGRSPLVLDYQISADAVYSDGKPVTCDDMVLAWAAQSGRFPGFDAANRAGYADIATVDCVPGQKKARVTFAQDRPFVDFGQLFAATSMMPSHVLADELGLGDAGVTTALQSADGPTIDRIAAAWNTVWELKPGLDLKRFPSSGPYKLDSVTDTGAVVLVANDKWWGAPPITARVTVWPRGADIQDRINNGDYDVVDVAAGSSGTLNVPDDYVRTDSPSAGIEQLIFAPTGPLADPAARRALASCTPRDLIARNAEVPIANTRLNPAAEDSITAAESVAEGGQFSVANPVAARGSPRPWARCRDRARRRVSPSRTWLPSRSGQWRCATTRSTC
jgi:peptide/nickel transport system substrate-binding protein